ncbi:3-hydroxyacyl-CoA dehydrogenase NAD-binding domain-containing protein [Palleronia pelagia]|uniref:Enoyl-CoA hydratase/isomerase n=1 Tax=Palleronia pelagia TaxID=387096 RepID=A0A1H8JZL4_9RHOB|nr:3-hydroxyacyl-CoA dehydrogenase NAD-binding domain-containing protein [Palleronia pelagia]SEN85618.1 Enoyl-CoA hydratase/isomerase [Palleronia pelagia]
MSIRMDRDVAVITLPAWLDEQGLSALGLELDQALGDANVRGVVLEAARPGVFCRGLPLDRLDDPAPRRLAERLRAAEKPVIAALAGLAAAQGAELALAAGMRVAHPGAVLRLNDISLGLPPAALATATLPSLVGGGPSLAMLLGGRAVALGKAPAGLVDLVDPDPVGAAVALAHEGTPAPERDGLSDPGSLFDATAAARVRARGDDLALRIIDGVEATLTVPSGVASEMAETARTEALDNDRARALIHLAQVEQEMDLTPPAAGLPGRIAIVGGTQVAGAIAVAALRRGVRVDLVGLDDEGLARAAETVLGRIDTLTSDGRLSEAGRDAMLARFAPRTEIEVLSEADMVVEAATSARELRSELAQAIAVLTRPGVPVLLGGSDSDPVSLVGTARAADAVGFHLPRQSAALAEIAVAKDGSEKARDAAAALVRAMARRPLVVRPTPGRVLARLEEAGLSACESLLVRGADVPALEQALAGLGLAKTPLARAARRGFSEVQAERRAWNRGAGGPIDILLRAGGDGLEDLDSVAAEIRSAAGNGSAAMGAEAIRTAWTALVVAEAVEILAAGGVRRTGDLDVASLHALGLPRNTGGILHLADRMGLLRIANALRDMGETPHKLIDVLIRNGKGFASI